MKYLFENQVQKLRQYIRELIQNLLATNQTLKHKK